MDNLAHTLIGVGVARAGLSRKFGPGTTLTVALASNLPDVDALYAFWDGWDRFMLRRTHTHALVAIPLLAAALAFLVRLRYPQQSWRTLFGLSALGIGLHVLFDVVNSFGVVILWPFDRTRVELASVFIVDVAIWAILLAPLVAGRFLSSVPSRERAYRGALAALGLYLVACVGAHARVEALLRARHAGEADAIRVFPEPLGPQRFRAAVRSGSTWTLYLCRPFSGRCEPVRSVPTDEASERVAQVRRSPRGRDLDWFMAAPVWTLLPDGSVEARDLRFETVVVPRPNPFVVRFPPGRTDPVPR